MANALAKRLSPLGLDRDYNRYWHLPDHQGVYVEKGWADVEHHYNVYSAVPEATDVEKPEPFV